MMRILNLGCGTKASSDPAVVNIDWSIYLRFKRRKLLAATAPIFFRGRRLEKFKALPENILVHNLAKGIPFESNSVDAVYHSHVLEHLDRKTGKAFVMEVHRVLKPGGVHRIVVPDLEEACQRYLEHIAVCDGNAEEAGRHDTYVAAMIEQCVRSEAGGTSRQTPVRRYVENLILGSARQRGETHQWMYDRINLGALLRDCGYRDVRQQQFDSSLIANWNKYGLDQKEDGTEYKEESLYMEGVK